MPTTYSAADYAAQYTTSSLGASYVACLLKEILTDSTGDQTYVVSVDLLNCNGEVEIPADKIESVQQLGMRPCPNGSALRFLMLELRLTGASFERTLLEAILAYGHGLGDVSAYAHGSDCGEQKDDVRSRRRHTSFGRCDFPTKAEAQVEGACLLVDLTASTGCAVNHASGAEKVEHWRDTPFGTVYWDTWLAWAGCDDPARGCLNEAPLQQRCGSECKCGS